MDKKSKETLFLAILSVSTTIIVSLISLIVISIKDRKNLPKTGKTYGAIIVDQNSNFVDRKITNGVFFIRTLKNDFLILSQKEDSKL
ncbi:MAG: hypothetical protein WC827_00105 [Candidatus Paceibacterota bacterium]|jgi:hypothetical protein